MQPPVAGGRQRAEALDREDPLSGALESFVVADSDLVYLDGNSLGRLPRATLERVSEVVGLEWGTDLIASWGKAWTELPGRVGDLIGTRLLGARPGEVIGVRDRGARGR